jgi:immune inhibitor A
MAATAIALLLFLALTVASCNGGNGAQSPSPSATTSPPVVTQTVEPTTTPEAGSQPPGRDLIDLARRFRGLPPDAPRLARQTPYSYQTGDRETFTLVDLNTPKLVQISATVRYISDHAYFFVEDGVSASDSALQSVAQDFESIVYPTVHADFGSEWTPGVDSDPRITILHANLRGAYGYFSAGDEYSLAAVPYTNEREMLYLAASALGSPGPRYNALVAHELQHLVHWNADPDEDTWVSEGLSQVAAEAVGGGSDWLGLFLQAPDTQLNLWPVDNPRIHYAASELFFSYLLQRFGGFQNASRLLQEPADGIAGVDAYLQPFGATFRDVFADWVIANYLDADEGPYSHPGIDARVTDVTRINLAGNGSGTVAQFAADYFHVDPPGDRATFSFDGSATVSNGVPQHDGAFWWSGRGDAIDSRLTREFDLTGVASATLRFSAWWDTELGWDYGYVAASTDGGRSWTALRGSRTSDYDPVQSAYGPGYTGQSGGWVDEQMDLTPFAGQKVLLRFELVNDDSTDLTGFAVDDIEIPEIGFRDTADSDAGWQVEGFRQVQGPLAQQFIVQVIPDGDQPTVRRVGLDTHNHADVELGGPATIVISGATEDTAEPSSYAWSLATP